MNYKTEKSRISLVDENGKELAFITFPETESGVYNINHTVVDESLRGQGIAGKLVKMAVDEINRLGGKVTATCSYAVKWLEKNK